MVSATLFSPFPHYDLVMRVIEHVGSESGLDLNIFGGGKFAGEFLAITDDPGIMVFFLDDAVFPATTAT